jgi:hypothetical protein
MEALFQEKILKARLRRVIEPTDPIVKDMVMDSMRNHQCADAREVIKYLQGQHTSFWMHLEADQYLLQWLQLVGSSVKQSLPSISMKDLQSWIWESFIRRLSLDVWLIFQDSHHSVPPQGNLLVTLLSDAIEETIYRQFELTVTAPTPLPPPPIRNDHLYRDLFSNTISTESRRSAHVPVLERIPENETLSDTNMKIMAPTTAASNTIRLRRVGQSAASGGRKTRKKKDPEDSSSSSSSDSESDHERKKA